MALDLLNHAHLTLILAPLIAPLLWQTLDVDDSKGLSCREFTEGYQVAS